MTDKDKIKFAIRYLKKGLKSKRTPPLYEELMNELGFVKEGKSESCCQRCALPNDLVGSAWCTQHCQHDNRFKRNKEFAELNDKLNNLSSVAEVRLANWQKYAEENKELNKELGKVEGKLADLTSEYYELENLKNKEIAELKAYNEKLLNGDIEKHNKIVELKEQVDALANVNIKAQNIIGKAKEIIKWLLKETYGEGWNYSLQVKVEAEKFLKELEQ